MIHIVISVIKRSRVNAVKERKMRMIMVKAVAS
jgi:hypothetical protein